MHREERLPVSGIAECFCSADFGSGAGSGEVAIREAIGKTISLYMLMQKSGIEGIAGANRINYLHWDGGHGD